MRLIQLKRNGVTWLGSPVGGDRVRVLGEGSLDALIREGRDLSSFAAGRHGEEIGLDDAEILPPLVNPGKIVCIGLNYVDHTKESKYEQPAYPTIFLRVATTLIGHNAPLLRPPFSDSLDYEGELALVMKGGGRLIPRDRALDHVAGYALFNDASVREYQFKAPQWTPGKNFDGTGAFGPEFVTADEVPPGGRGLRLETRLNDKVVQSASTSDMIFDVETLISTVSEVMSLQAGDVIVTGTPSGIGWAREPKLLMQPGDVCSISVDGFMTLRNPVVADPAPRAA